MADIEDEPAEKPEKMENYEVKKADFMHVHTPIFK